MFVVSVTLFSLQQDVEVCIVNSYERTLVQQAVVTLDLRQAIVLLQLTTWDQTQLIMIHLSQHAVLKVSVNCDCS